MWRKSAIGGPVGRVWRYVKAYTEFSRLDRQSAALVDQPRQLVARCFNHSDGFLKPVQRQEELALLLEDVRRLNPRTVLEIGTSMGGTLFLWTRLAAPDATIISVDLRGGKFGGGYSSLRIPIYRRFARMNQKLHLLRADSHSPSTLNRVNRLLLGSPIDFLFIDGDHSFEGVKQDWEMYSPLVRKGGLIVFHDVAGNYEDTQVKRFWDTIKTGYAYREYTDDPEKRYGVGVLSK